jgi:hypothetical protein
MHSVAEKVCFGWETIFSGGKHIISVAEQLFQPLLAASGIHFIPFRLGTPPDGANSAPSWSLGSLHWYKAALYGYKAPNGAVRALSASPSF